MKTETALRLCLAVFMMTAPGVVMAQASTPDKDRAAVLGTIFSQSHAHSGAEPVLSAGALTAHAERQIRHLLQDRMEMERIIAHEKVILIDQESAPEIWKWIHGRFAGEKIGVPVYWDPAQPMSPNGAESDPGVGGGPARVLIADIGKWSPTPNLACEQLWFSLIFELNNLESRAQFLRHMAEAREGKLDAEAFTIAMARIEYGTCLKTEAFWNQIWRPWADKTGFTSKPALWRCTCGLGFDDWLKVERKVTHGYYPDQCYHQMYEWLVKGK